MSDRPLFGRSARCYVAPVAYTAGLADAVDVADLVEIVRAKDITRSDSAAEMKATARDLPYAIYEQGDKTLFVELEKLIEDDESADDIAVVRDAFDNDEELWVLVTPKASDVAAGAGVLFRAIVINRPEKFPESDAATVSMKFASSGETVQLSRPATPLISLTVPGTQSGTEDTGKTVNGTSISAGDDSGNAAVQLSCDHGTLTLASTTGLSFTTGDGTADASMNFTGSIADINTAIASLILGPTANFNGAATITVTALNEDETLATTQTITVNFAAVNDAPFLGNVVTVTDSAGNFPRVLWPTGTVTEIEGQNITALGISIFSGAVAGDKFDGPTTGGGITVSGNGTNALTLSGSASAAAYEATLQQITFEPGSGTTGNRTLDVGVTDASSASRFYGPHIIVT